MAEAQHTHTWVKTSRFHGTTLLIVLSCPCGDEIVRVPYSNVPKRRRRAKG